MMIKENKPMSKIQILYVEPDPKVLPVKKFIYHGNTDFKVFIQENMTKPLWLTIRGTSELWSLTKGDLRTLIDSLESLHNQMIDGI